MSYLRPKTANSTQNTSFPKHQKFTFLVKRAIWGKKYLNALNISKRLSCQINDKNKYLKHFQKHQKFHFVVKWAIWGQNYLQWLKQLKTTFLLK